MINTFNQVGGIGDINSTEKGSGARFNAGKPPLELIPIRVIANHYEIFNIDLSIEKALHHLAAFQEGGGAEELYGVIDSLGIEWTDIANVFGYGQQKYAAWNWAKGMKWSVPIACIARHIVLGLLAGEENDPESGLPHKGHIGCNVVMLLTYMRNYKEGDDRPKEILK